MPPDKRSDRRQISTRGPSLQETLVRPWYIWSKFAPLSVTHPEIAAQWHPTRNGTATPDEYTFASGADKIWWKCPAADDHVWTAMVVQRTKSKSPGMGCPFCRGLRPSVTNSLASLYPDVAQELHPTKNGKTTAADIVAGSHRKYWWKCKSGHVWDAKANDRTSSKAGCRGCAGRMVTKENSLTAVVPKAKNYWHPEKNGALRPSEVSFGSSQIVHFKCPIGPDHEWSSSVSAFAKSWREGTTGCPHCSGHRLSVTNMLSVLFPDIAREWHKTKNGKLKPEQIHVNSVTKRWWQCEQDKQHVWDGSPYERTKEGRTCPFCRNWWVTEAFSLAALCPNVAEQWHPTLNGTLKPSEVSPKSSRKVWWLCRLGHEFQAKIVWQALIDKERCSVCRPRRVPFEKSLLAKDPKLAEQFHPTRNAPLTAEDFTPRSSKKIVWQCPVADDHFWEQTPAIRSRSPNCPFCCGNRVALSNCFATLHPDLAAQWHPSKNKERKPTDFTAGSGQKFWWICTRNPKHTWEASIEVRVRGHGCGECEKERRLRGIKNN